MSNFFEGISSKHTYIPSLLLPSKREQAPPSQKNLPPRAEGISYLNHSYGTAFNSPSPSHRVHSLFPREDDGALNFSRALEKMDDAGRRGLLLRALNHFAHSGDEGKVEEILGLLELSLPLLETPEHEFLQLYTRMVGALQGSGIPQENSIIEKARALAESPRDEHAPLVVQVRRALAALEFFQIAGAVEQIQGQVSILLDLQKEIGQGPGDDPLTLARLSVQIDQALLPHYLKNATDPELKSNLPVGEILGRLGAFRELLSAGDARPLEKRVSDGALLAQAFSNLKNPVVESQIWKSEVHQAMLGMEKIFAEIFTQDPRAPQLQKEVAESIVQDLGERYSNALRHGDHPWLEQLDLEAIGEFATASQAAHLLLIQAQDPRQPDFWKKHLQAGALFSKLGLPQRVLEALKPLETLCSSMEAGEGQASKLFQLSQIYQLGGLVPEANRLFDEIVALHKRNGDPQIQSLAQRAYLYRQLNRGNIHEAENYLRTQPQGPDKDLLLAKLRETAEIRRLSLGSQILSVALSDYMNRIYENEPESVFQMKEPIRNLGTKIYRLLLSGEVENFSKALEQASRGSPICTQLKNFIYETNEGTQLLDLLVLFTEAGVSDRDLLEEALGLARTFSLRNFQQTTQWITYSVQNSPYADENLKALAKDLEEDIPTTALLGHAFFAAQELIAMFSVAGNFLNPNIQMDKEFFTRAGLTVGTLGIARSVGVGAQAWWVSRMENSLISPLTFRLSTLGVRSVSEAATFPLASMTFRTLARGETGHWNLKDFGTEFGANLVMFSLLNSSALSLQWGQARARAGGAKFAERVLRSDFTAWGSRVAAFTLSSYANEAAGLRDHESGSAFFARFLNSAVVDAQMTVGGKVVDAVSGGRIGKLERATELGMQRHFALTKLVDGQGMEETLQAWMKDLIQSDQRPVTEEGLVIKMMGEGKDHGESGIITKGEGAKYLKGRENPEEPIEVHSQVAEVRHFLTGPQLAIVRDIYIRAGKKPPRSITSENVKFIYQAIKGNSRLYRSLATAEILFLLLNNFPELLGNPNGPPPLSLQSMERGFSINFPHDSDSITLGRQTFMPFHLLGKISKRRIRCISQKHAKLGRDEEGRFYLQDLDSKNGTLVNGEKISPFEIIYLSPGDKISLSGLDLTIPHQENPKG